MPGRPSPKRYAQAVLDLALSNDTLDEWSKELDQISEVVDDTDFVALLEAPQVPEVVKHQGIETVLADLSQLARNLLSVLVKHHQPRITSQIRDQYQALVDTHRGIARAHVVTAVSLKDNQKELLRKQLGNLVNADVLMTEEVNSEIIAGVIARIGDHLIDGSTRTRLQGIRKTLEQPPS